MASTQKGLTEREDDAAESGPMWRASCGGRGTLNARGKVSEKWKVKKERPVPGIEIRGGDRENARFILVEWQGGGG